MDDEGLVLADDQAAMANAVKEVRALAGDTITRGHLTRHHRIEVTDEGHAIVGAVRIDEAVEIRD